MHQKAPGTVAITSSYKPPETKKYVYVPPTLQRYMLAHSTGVEYANAINWLDFSVIDPFSVWAVFADYDRHQVCIGQVFPVSRCEGDAVYAVGVDSGGLTRYVSGTANVPGVVSDRLTDLSGRGEFAVFKYSLPCVTVKALGAENETAPPSTRVPVTIQ